LRIGSEPGGKTERAGVIRVSHDEEPGSNRNIGNPPNYETGDGMTAIVKHANARRYEAVTDLCTGNKS
jgi:hypothetical protein